MIKRILISTNELNETRLAMLENNLLSNLEIENKKGTQKKGNIYKGIITKIEPSLDAVFVDYGVDKEGFLPFKEIIKEYLYDDIYNKNVLDKDLITKGKELIVQIEKDVRKNKSAALTTYISLAGSYLVLMPKVANLEGISRHIDGEIRNNLKEKLCNINIPDDMGIILRTAGINRSLEELKWELNILLLQYKLIKNSNKIFKAPFLIHEESNLIVRAIRDYLRPDVKEIIIDDIKIFNSIYKYLSGINSDFICNLKLYSENIPLFNKYNIEQQIELAFKREVFLPSGGSIIIDNTEALISIDVNSSKSNRGFDINETALHTNLEALNEIARQMRLRDLGGLIVVDFIDMPDINSNKIIEKKLKELIFLDKAKIQIGKISKFGLLELSRQRIKSSYHEINQELCLKCGGTGRTNNIEILSLRLLKSIEEEAFNTDQINVEIPLKLMTYLINTKKSNILKMEKKYNINIILIANNQLVPSDYKIYKLKAKRKINNYIKDDIIEINSNDHISNMLKLIIRKTEKKRIMSGGDLLSHRNTIIGAT